MSLRFFPALAWSVKFWLISVSYFLGPSRYRGIPILVREEPKLLVKDRIMDLVSHDLRIKTSLKSPVCEFKHLVASVVYRGPN